MANVGFKRGSQANFDKLTSYAEGIFYLTTDTNRLYVAQSNTKAELLNQGIKVYNYDDVFGKNSTVPKTEGQFYYLKDKNILCTYSNGEWNQINADTNTYEKITGFSITKDKEPSVSNAITYTIGIGTQEYDHTTAGNTNTHTQSLVIKAEDLAAITSETAVGVTASNTTGGVILASKGVGSDSNSNVKIVGAGTASVSAESNTITITSNAAKLNAPAANSTAFTFENGTGSGNVTVQFVGDGTVVASNKNAQGTIKFEHATSGVTAQEYKVSNSSSDNTTTINVPKFTVNSTGHITNASTEKVVLTDNNNTYSFGDNAILYEDNVLKIQLSNQNSDNTSGEGSTAAFDGLYFKANVKDVNGSSKEVTKYLQDNLGEFYTANTVDQLIKDAAANMNAMTYKGVISNSNFSALTAASTNKGDTYKASDSFVITGTNVSVNAGDLLIYNGDDGTNKLANWDVVPSGDDIDTQYALQSASVTNGGAQVSLYNKTTQSTDSSFQILGSNGVSASISNGTITVKHSNSITPNSNKAVISDHTLTVYDLTYDSQGHITGKTANPLTLPDNNTTYTLSAGSNKIVLTDSNSTPQSVPVSGDSYLTVTADAANGIKVKHNSQTAVPADTAVGSSEQSPGYGGSFNIPQVTVDAAGHVTALSSQAITLPAKQIITATSNFACESNSNKMTAGYTIEGDGVTTASLKFGFSSSSLAISNTGSDNVCSIDLVWGTF